MSFVTLLDGVFSANPDGHWAQWAGPNRNFQATGSFIHSGVDENGIRELWRAPIGGGNSGTCIDKESVVTFFSEAGKEHVQMHSIKDGSLRWKKSFEVPYSDVIDAEFGIGPHASPLISDGILFCVGSTGRLNALKLQSGKTLWEVQLWKSEKSTRLERGYASSPVIFKDTIILQVGGAGQSIQCYSIRDGKICWRKHDYVNSYSSPVIVSLNGRHQLVALLDQELVGIDPATGNLIWSQSIPSKNYVHCVSPMVANDGTIIVNTMGGLRAFRVRPQANGYVAEQVWTSRLKICQTGNFCIIDERIYGASGGGIFTAIDAKTGKISWQSRTLGRCAFVYQKNSLLAVEETGQVTLAIIKSDGPSVKWRTKPLTGRCWVGPAVVGRVFVVRDSRQVIAFEFSR